MSRLNSGVPEGRSTLRRHFRELLVCCSGFVCLSAGISSWRHRIPAFAHQPSRWRRGIFRNTHNLQAKRCFSGSSLSVFPFRVPLCTTSTSHVRRLKECKGFASLHGGTKHHYSGRVGEESWRTAVRSMLWPKKQKSFTTWPAQRLHAGTVTDGRVGTPHKAPPCRVV